MPLNQSQNRQLKRSLLISASLKKKILKNWDSLSSARQKAILDMVNLSTKMQQALIKQAFQNNHDFPTKFAYFVKGKQRKKHAQKEKEEAQSKSQKAEKLFSDFD